MSPSPLSPLSYDAWIAAGKPKTHLEHQKGNDIKHSRKAEKKSTLSPLSPSSPSSPSPPLSYDAWIAAGKPKTHLEHQKRQLETEPVSAGQKIGRGVGKGVQDAVSLLDLVAGREESTQGLDALLGAASKSTGISPADLKRNLEAGNIQTGTPEVSGHQLISNLAGRAGFDLDQESTGFLEDIAHFITSFALTPFPGSAGKVLAQGIGMAAGTTIARDLELGKGGELVLGTLGGMAAISAKSLFGAPSLKQRADSLYNAVAERAPALERLTEKESHAIIDAARKIAKDPSVDPSAVGRIKKMLTEMEHGGQRQLTKRSAMVYVDEPMTAGQALNYRKRLMDAISDSGYGKKKYSSVMKDRRRLSGELVGEIDGALSRIAKENPKWAEAKKSADTFYALYKDNAFAQNKFADWMSNAKVPVKLPVIGVFSGVLPPAVGASALGAQGLLKTLGWGARKAATFHRRLQNSPEMREHYKELLLSVFSGNHPSALVQLEQLLDLGDDIEEEQGS